MTWRTRCLAVLTFIGLSVAALVLLPLAVVTGFQARRLYTAGCRVATRAILRMWGIRLVVRHVREDAPWPTGQCVYIANHTSTIDIIALVALGMPNTRFFLAGFVKWYGPLGILAALMGTFFTVPQTRPAERARIFARADRILRRTDESVFLSPEGARITTGEVGPFNKGAFHLATSLKVPIVPLYLSIPRDIDPGMGLGARPGTMTVHVKPAIDTSGWQVEDVVRNKEAVRDLFVAWNREDRKPRGADDPRGRPFRGDTLVDLLRYRASVQTDDPAYVFLHNGEEVRDRLTWAALDRKSRAVALALGAYATPGDRALLLFPPGLDFIPAFFGCLYAGVIAVPVPLPQTSRADRTAARLAAVIANAKPSVIMTTADALARWSVDRVRALGSPILAVDTCADDAVPDGDQATPRQWPPIGGRTTAFLQYTSGSTGEPKGVIVTHGNLLHNLAYGYQEVPNNTNSASVSWLPATHDMGLIEGILQPAFSGSPAYLMSPAAFLQRPSRWLAAISKYRATRSGGPNFAYELCARRVRPEDLKTLDLSCWHQAFSGSEPVRAETLTTFTALCAARGFSAAAWIPCYGLAESTLFVSGGRWDGRTQGTVACGTPRGGTRVVIVDPVSGAPRREGEAGEIWIASPSVAEGYWQRPDETRLTFQATLEGEPARFLRTGDLGHFLGDVLTVTGRIKDVLIVRGVKHFPQDLEATAEQFDTAIGLGAVAAVSVGADASGDWIALVAEVDPRRRAQATTSGDRMAALRSAVATVHGIQLHTVALVGPGMIPRTTSGKLRRAHTGQAIMAGALPVIAMWRGPAEGLG
jgi:1-acyl-sn-glycerol-3-phosphate acyltransferase